MKRAFLKGLLLLIVLFPLQSQSFRTGAIPGWWTGDAVPWVRYYAAAVSPLVAGRFDLDIPGGAGLVDWEPLSATVYGAGWSVGGPDWSTLAFFGSGSAHPWKTKWDVYHLDWVFDAPAVFLTVNRWGPVTFGGGAIELRSWARYLQTLNVGAVDGQAWGAFVSGFGLTIVGLEARSHADATVSAFIFSPIQLSGDFLARALIVAGDPGFVQGPWRWGLGWAAGLAWISEGSWTYTHQWLSIIPTFPFFTTLSSQTEYRLSGSPAWGLLLRPRVSFELIHGVRIEAARWLPLTGGWTWGVVDGGFTASSGPANASQGTSSTSVSIDPRNLWAAGLELSVLVDW